MNDLGHHPWIIPLLPLVATAVTALLPRRARTPGATIALAAMALSLVVSCFALRNALTAPREVSNFIWFELGRTSLQLGFLNDPLTAIMCVMVCFVGLLIFIFSLGYMREDANFTRFFCFLSLFAAAMLGLLVANSLLLLFVCWELVGLASYLLIGFWFHKPEAAAAAKKAFIVTRIGDLGFLLGLLWLYHATGSLLFYDNGSGVLETNALLLLGTHTTIGGLAVSTAIGLLIFCGAAGKSGQFPLHVWLPDAMEGPTPVSALIHAATMVAAGVFLIARIYPLMEADKILADVPIHALTVVAFVGAITALLGALIAIAQNDLKRVLAFSTVSQLGYMMLALGVGSWVAAIFHLLTHAFFKALLFLGAGSVIHAAHHEQDVRRLGGLSARMRVTFATFAIGMMALAGVPFLFSGFWSKEAILHAAHGWEISHLPFYAGLVAVVLTAFYMTRLVAEVFAGNSRSHAAEHAHESPKVMTVPLVILAIGAIGLGFLGTPAWPWLQSALTGTPVEVHSLGEGAGLTVLSIVLVALGIGTGWALYRRRPRVTVTARDPLATFAPAVLDFLGARMKFDELYAATLGRLNAFVASLADFFDRWVWGGVIQFIALLGEVLGTMTREADEDGINRAFNGTSETLRGAGKLYSRAQTGRPQSYLRVLALGFVAIAVVAIWGGSR